MPKEPLKAPKGAKPSHDLHVLLLMREGAAKSDALVIAYLEGAAGLDARLNPKGGAS